MIKRYECKEVIFISSNFILEIFPIYSDKKWHVNRPENPFHDTFFKIIPCKRFYALLALKVGCQNIEGDLNILGLSS